jgi:hypothetical protein
MSTGLIHVTQAPTTDVTAPAKPAVHPASSTRQTTVAKPAANTAKVPTDTVQISSAARALVQESLETKTQTLQEAAKGDPQAARLLAKQAVVRKNG